MSEVIFKSSCLASDCDDNEIVYWHHSKCPSTSNYYLSEEGILRCGYCNETCRLLSCFWKSNSCSHESRKTDFPRLSICISRLMYSENIPGTFIRRLLRNLTRDISDME